MDLKNLKIKDLIEAYLQTEQTTVADVELPDDKAATKTKAGQASKKRKKSTEEEKKKKKKKSSGSG